MCFKPHVLGTSLWWRNLADGRGVRVNTIPFKDELGREARVFQGLQASIFLTDLEEGGLKTTGQMLISKGTGGNLAVFFWQNFY